MSVVIRLTRVGTKKRPFFRVVAADSRRQRDGRNLEILGHYDPLTDPLVLRLDAESVQRWIKNGARPSLQVRSLLKQAGIEIPRPAARAAAAEEPAKKPAKRRVRRQVSKRKVMRRALRKSGKRKPAVKKPRKAKAK